MTADEALERLRQGNARFRTGRATGEGRDRARLAQLAQRQSPFAVIHTCSDSRVPPEILFDTGLGDLFVIRNAGNVANPSGIASVEFAVKTLGTKLVVVMAHERCGAVEATVKGNVPSENLRLLTGYIKPALDPMEGDVDVIARRSARINAERLTGESDIVRAAVDKDGVRIVTAFFRFRDGEVVFD